ncbi:MAG: trypsin-like serine protease [Hyphomicrobiaceae bacterium]|nr:MAG: trypsin-like serine protease [Hyphomicrobiaceae bacterium]
MAVGCRPLLPARLVSTLLASVALWPWLAMAAPLQSSTARPPSRVERVAVFGTDDRTVPPSQYAAIKNQIGLVYNTQAKTVCTAFCLGPKLVATAAHCVFKISGADKLPKLSDFVVAMPRAVDREMSPISGATLGSAQQNVISGANEIRVKPPIDAASDWALLRLANPICEGAFEVKALPAEELVQKARAGQVFMLSYHRDYPDWRLAYSKPCEVEQDYKGSPKWTEIKRDFSRSDLLILHRCDTGGASSGGPILVEGKDGVFVAGINVGTYVQSRVTVRDQVPSRRARQEVVANTAVSVAAFASLIDVFRDARIIETADGLRALQQRLAALKLYSGAIDGAYGPKLKAAIAEFERSRGLAPTGIASETLLRLSTEAVAVPTSAPVVPGPLPRRPPPPIQRLP